MILRKDSWTHAEDETIIATFLGYAQRGEKQSNALDYLKEVLYPRTRSAITQRWHNYLKHHVLGNPLYNQIDATNARVPEEPSIIPFLDMETCIRLLSATYLDDENKEAVNSILRKHLYTQS